MLLYSMYESLKENIIPFICQNKLMGKLSILRMSDMRHNQH